MSNGIYMGGVGMGGERSLDVRNLAEEIKAGKKAFGDVAAKRKTGGVFGDFLKTAFPGWGHLIDLGIDVALKERYKFPDVDLTETMWTEGEAGKYEESFAEAEKSADPSFVENLLSSLISYGGTEAGGEFFGDLFKKKPVSYNVSLPRAAKGGYIPKYQEGGGVPTISDYFNMQGKSLGGNNKQSLAEMLGRK